MLNKKIFGIKISTYLSAIGCVALAIVIWVIVKMTSSTEEASAIKLILSNFV